MYDSAVCFMLIVKCSNVHEMEENIPVPGHSGAQSSVALTRWQQFKERVCYMCGVQSDFACPFSHSG